jgi:NADH-quinone oxidoreductase subunit G
VFPKGQAKDDWTILRALSEHLGKTLPYDTLEQLRAKLMSDHPTFGQVDYVAGHTGAASFDVTAVGEAGPLGDVPFKSGIEDFYMTNPIARASVTMAECSALHAQASRAPMAAE